MSTNSVRAALAMLLEGGALPAPGPPSPGAGSIASTDGSAIYEVSPERGGTVITKIRGSDRTAVATRRLRGSFERLAVAGLAGGLSHDGRTLVVAGHPRAAMTQFALLDTRRCAFAERC